MSHRIEYQFSPIVYLFGTIIYEIAPIEATSFFVAGGAKRRPSQKKIQRIAGISS